MVAQEKLGIKNDDLIRAMDPFGGGLGAQGEVCGSVIGGLPYISDFSLCFRVRYPGSFFGKETLLTMLNY